MIKITLIREVTSQKIQEWTFNDQPVIRIGRSPDNDIVINDVLVSRHHLEIRQVKNQEPLTQWEIHSTGTNGTFVNNILMSRGTVCHESLIQLARGGPLFKFEIDHSPQSNQKLPKIPLHSGELTCTHQGNPSTNIFCIHCGQPIEVMFSIKDYQILKQLGQGGMGTTYKAWNPKKFGKTLVVLKEMNADMAEIEKARELFEREARVLQSLEHPRIPKFLDYFVEEHKKYLVMELVHGVNLEKLILDKGPVNIQRAIKWMIQTCEVLDYIHSQKPPLIHRDIKPANLMIRNINQEATVLDFGAVKEIGTKPGTRIGAPDYCAHEQSIGKPVTQSDLYAIGPSLIFLLTSQSPMNFYKKPGQGSPFDLSSIPAITPKLSQVIEKVTMRSPIDRYQTARELSLALENCL